MVHETQLDQVVVWSMMWKFSPITWRGFNFFLIFKFEVNQVTVKSLYIESQFSQMLDINKIINNLVLDNSDISRMASLLIFPFYFLFLLPAALGVLSVLPRMLSVA